MKKRTHQAKYIMEITRINQQFSRIASVFIFIFWGCAAFFCERAYAKKRKRVKYKPNALESRIKTVG
jgi:hypothetical protein